MGVLAERYLDVSLVAVKPGDFPRVAVRAGRVLRDASWGAAVERPVHGAALYAQAVWPAQAALFAPAELAVLGAMWGPVDPVLRAVCGPGPVWRLAESAASYWEQIVLPAGSAASCRERRVRAPQVSQEQLARRGVRALRLRLAHESFGAAASSLSVEARRSLAEDWLRAADGRAVVPGATASIVSLLDE